MANEEIGSWVSPPVPSVEYPWFALGMRNRHLAVAGARMLDGEICHEITQRSFKSKLGLSNLGEVFSVGPTHHLIGHIRGRESIGAFTFDDVRPSDVPLRPSLWAVAPKSQTSLVVPPTHEGEPVRGREELQRDVLGGSSDLFVSRTLGMASQRLAAAVTLEPTLGGRAWTSLTHSDPRVKRAAALWLNSTLGLLVRLGYALTTQPGRATLGVKAMAGHPIPDFAEESDAGEWARLVVEDQFDRLANLELEAAAYAWRDRNRHEIDWVVLEMLGIDCEEARRAVRQIREMWCREPSVHGGNRKIMNALGI